MKITLVTYHPVLGWDTENFEISDKSEISDIILNATSSDIDISCIEIDGETYNTNRFLENNF